jgi:hypothetical protein
VSAARVRRRCGQEIAWSSTVRSMRCPSLRTVTVTDWPTS